MTCPYCGFVTPYWTVSFTCPICKARVDFDDVPYEGDA